jgi:Cof subfamily protein (haloacid dehalogenase superfamily)
VKSPLLVASDLDGTLLRADGSVSQRTVDAIAAVQEAGIGWVVATARPPRWMDGLGEVVGRGGVAICSNGAFVYDVARGAVVAERTLHIAVTIELVEDLRVAVADIAFALECQDGFAREHAFVDEYREGSGRRADNALELVDRPVGKLLARSPSMENAIFLATVAEVVGERAVMAYSGATGLAEISAAGVTKAAVLDELCLTRRIDPRDVWAFGDMPNDLAMLGWAGTAYAVANAHPDVQAAADHVVASNDDDGVAQTLEALLHACA